MLGRIVGMAAVALAGAACATTQTAAGEDFTNPGFAGVPDVEPTQTLSIRGDEYDLYVSENEGKYVTRVCVRYVQTGSRIERNTCDHGPADNVVTVNYRGFMFSDTTRHVGLTEDARFVAMTATRMLNGSVTIEDLEQELRDELRRQPADRRQPANHRTVDVRQGLWNYRTGEPNGQH